MSFSIAAIHMSVYVSFQDRRTLEEGGSLCEMHMWSYPGKNSAYAYGSPLAQIWCEVPMSSYNPR